MHRPEVIQVTAQEMGGVGGVMVPTLSQTALRMRMWFLSIPDVLRNTLRMMSFAKVSIVQALYAINQYFAALAISPQLPLF